MRAASQFSANPPASSSKHFSCNLPFFGTANNNLSFKLSTNNDMVDSAPKDDLAGLELEPAEVSELGVWRNGGSRMVDASSESEGVSG